jgi:addiction module RelB/DinJ family antitoxin
MKTMINIKTDRAVKERAQRVARELGLNLSMVVNASLRQMIRSQAVYFSTAPQMTPELENLIGRARTDYKRRRNISPLLTSNKEVLDYLHS